MHADARWTLIAPKPATNLTLVLGARNASSCVGDVFRIALSYEFNSPRSLSAGVAYGRAASAVSGAFRGRKYDKLPLVPNMEEDPPSDDDGNLPVTDGTGQFSV